ncbi:putative pentatricopeptide repeat-containing protein At3g18840 [Lycium ferocissimum]|uniref:putative pentatricopeptide repeat-containing protein At3g18840 n=1 Tax=Lycium ferocissimum TaxID=112874 RepID=UPI0028156F3E|nr:putative pentatricopeptide repeat-containing protein At3g18840 [Lycium ferocissimum]XP_059312508.1 putative pentatricopeptide repeat-containing protein At3g18840 [Lycium ferocissimum]XP_059312509.1 putative pentatricopeptide repeat-containing protein At3g18840 [Lycium ferocissimum]XP_059312510.1 putative pentatricopeptide repeat-containing protein At3g18840 [Lycium ferocissimum]XP_059312511.1 putative pentatricopeptide repeat-containing protein At3g18840 [Lycium ferocissimum]
MKSLLDCAKFQTHIIKSGLTPTIIDVNHLIHIYSKHSLIKDVQKLFDEMPERNVFTWNAIINTYVKDRNFVQARKLFNTAPLKDCVTYNTMLSGYVNCEGFQDQAVRLFAEMQFVDKVSEYALTTMVGLVTKLSLLLYGRQLHSYMLKSGNSISRYALSSLIVMYSKCGCFKDSWSVFDGSDVGFVDTVSKNAMVAACFREGELQMAQGVFLSMPQLNDEVSWNTMISGFAQNGYEEEAIELFRSMVAEGFVWNEHSFSSVISACSGAKNLKLGKEIHALILKEGMSLNPFLSSSLVNLYCKCGLLNYAHSVCTTTQKENPFAVTPLIVGYSGMGNMLEARRLFDSLPDKNHVVWTAMISGYVKAHQCEDAFQLFRELITQETTVPDELIFINLLGACAIHATFNYGKQIHSYILRTGTAMDTKLANSVVDMYSKSGNVTYAQRVFQLTVDGDSILYNSMIAGYGLHGYENEAIQLFSQMTDRGFQPDEVTFLALLSVCRHRGLVKMGEKYFFSMSKDYKISPGTDHYASMIDLYGRANQLDKAVRLMESLPVEPDAVILGAFLNACKMNRNAELAKTAEDKLLLIEGGNGSRYAQLAGIYASEGKWNEMGRVMKMMKGREAKKTAGCSWLYVGDTVHAFISGDRSHSDNDAIYTILGCLIKELTKLSATILLEEEMCTFR